MINRADDSALLEKPGAFSLALDMIQARLKFSLFGIGVTRVQQLLPAHMQPCCSQVLWSSERADNYLSLSVIDKSYTDVLPGAQRM